MNKIYVFIGASACGKTTLCTILAEAYSTLNKVVTDTTRLPRKGEIDKIHYNFVSEQFFRDNIDCYIEYNEYDGYLYGSNGRRIEKALERASENLLKSLEKKYQMW